MTSESELELCLYSNETGFIGKLSLTTSDETLLSKLKVATIVVLDRSGSMGNFVSRFVNRILPRIFKTLDYANDQIITLITFNDNANKYTIPVKELPKFKIQSQGCTYMALAISILIQTILIELPTDCHALRLLTISDGDVADQDRVQIEATQLTSLIKNDFIINSQAVRLFISTAQPDTRAVSNLKANLSSEEISTTVVNLFSSDSLNRRALFKSAEPILKSTPWQMNDSDAISLTLGENLFWLSKLSTDKLTIAQQAEYLRTMDISSKNARGLARRAIA
ncbi:unnamed protein product [Rotaria sordida]|uniref:VWFA domain-containing protein n=1 Tax=Rotaria sordida TaxID=392033 RepID=A0A815GVZ9_9BILA|nr:unnamed protein product [Rotaria sordida]CAF1344051.1 unnamed protein product [Rotaria sordida]